jgi:SPOR domain
MSRVEAAAATDRLPWLPDEPKPKPVKRRGNLPLWAAGAIVLVAAGAFWAGVSSVQPPVSSPVRQAKSTTVRLPEPRQEVPEVRIQAQPEVRLTPAPQVRSALTREIRIAAPPVQKPAGHETVATSREAEKTSETASAEQPAAAAPPAVAPPSPDLVVPKPWPPRVIAGAAGRLVQIGAFGSTHQAKRGWWFMVRAYPAVAHLPAVVTTTHNSRGRAFYRFQVGTTSQAHSEVLCQRMQKIQLSCAVVGLPWKAKVER